MFLFISAMYIRYILSKKGPSTKEYYRCCASVSDCFMSKTILYEAYIEGWLGLFYSYFASCQIPSLDSFKLYILDFWCQERNEQIYRKLVVVWNNKNNNNKRIYIAQFAIRFRECTENECTGEFRGLLLHRVRSGCVFCCLKMHGQWDAQCIM